MVPLHLERTNATWRCVIKRLHVPLEDAGVCVHTYAADPLSPRNLEATMANRGVAVDVLRIGGLIGVEGDSTSWTLGL